MFGSISLEWLPIEEYPGITQAQGISPNGIVVGSYLSTGRWLDSAGMLWSRSGARTVFHSGNGNHTHSAVNSDGIVAGNVIGLHSSPQAYYGPQDDVKVLQTTGVISVAGISEDGRAAGNVIPGAPNTKPYLTGVVFERHSLKAINANRANVIDAISPNGRYIVGRVGGSAAWLSTTIPPKPLNGAHELTPRDVSDRGEIVGSSLDHASLWVSDHLVDLNNRVAELPAQWTLTDAVGINSSGEIAVNATDSSGRDFPLKLTPR